MRTAAFLDLALGLANPVLGLVASGAASGAVFLVSTPVVLCAAVIAVCVLNCAVARHGKREVRIMSNNIEGKVVVIRGASSGPGEATADDGLQGRVPYFRA